MAHCLSGVYRCGSAARRLFHCGAAKTPQAAAAVGGIARRWRQTALKRRPLYIVSRGAAARLGLAAALGVIRLIGNVVRLRLVMRAAHLAAAARGAISSASARLTSSAAIAGGWRFAAAGAGGWLALFSICWRRGGARWHRWRRPPARTHGGGPAPAPSSHRSATAGGWRKRRTASLPYTRVAATFGGTKQRRFSRAVRRCWQLAAACGGIQHPRASWRRRRGVRSGRRSTAA